MLNRISVRALRHIAVWAVVIWVVVFWRLGYLSLLDPDEAHYAELTREMIRTRQWFVPVLQGIPFIDKPVLYHWLQAAAEWLFGENEFAVRFPSACAALALFWTVWWTGRSLFDDVVARRAALMFATMPLTFALANIGVFDMVYTAFLFGAAACLVVAAVHRRRRTEWVGWVLLALAVMVKGPVAVVLIVIFGAVLWAMPGTRPLTRHLQWGWGMLFVALVAAPWFVYMAAVFRGKFLRDYLLAGNLWYFTRPAEFSTRRGDALFYARTYFGACFPWSVLALGVGIDRLRARSRLSDPDRALWVWTLTVIGFFSLAGFKLDTYIFPAAPTTCLLVATALRDRSSASALRATSIASWLCAIVLIGGAVALGATMFRIDLGLSLFAVTLPIALALGGATVAILLWRRGAWAVTGALVATLLAAYAVVILEGFPVLERSRPTAPIGRWVNRHAPVDEPVGVYGLDDWRASLRFYSRRYLVVLHNGSEVAAFFEQHPASYILMLRSDANRLRAAGVTLERVGGRRAIVGRSGKFIRRQLWGRIVVTRAGGLEQMADAELDVDLDDN